MFGIREIRFAALPAPCKADVTVGFHYIHHIKNVGLHLYPSAALGPEKAFIGKRVECLPTQYVAYVP